jgi:hypothetical protein
MHRTWCLQRGMVFPDHANLFPGEEFASTEIDPDQVATNRAKCTILIKWAVAGQTRISANGS